MRRIDADKLSEVKFHSLPYTHITPSDVEAESYKRGWNDAIDSIIENAQTLEPERKKGKWIPLFDGKFTGGAYWFHCSKCERVVPDVRNGGWNFCPNCGADMREETDAV